MSIRLTVGVLILATLLLLTACSNPSEVEPPPAITGNYTGIYSYTEIHNGVDTVIDTTQLIEFIFRQQEFSMDINGSIPESLRVFCDVAGEYELGNGVDLTCDISLSPGLGTFTHFPHYLFLRNDFFLRCGFFLFGFAH